MCRGVRRDIIPPLPPEETQDETRIKRASLDAEAAAAAAAATLYFDALHSSAAAPPPPPLISYGIKAVTGYHNPISETIALSTSQRTKKPGSELNMHSAD